MFDYWYHGRMTEVADSEAGRTLAMPHRGYAAAMTYSARDVAAEIRRRIPGVPVKKVHKLLYYVQGHHLAVFGVPLFDESISAWDMGPVVGRLWYAEGQARASEDTVDLDEAGLNSIGYVVSRYGRLSGNELERLTHGEPPWQEANARRSESNRSERIDPQVLAAFFSAEPDGEDASSPPLDREAVAAWLGDVRPESVADIEEDTVESLLARLR